MYIYKWLKYIYVNQVAIYKIEFIHDTKTSLQNYFSSGGIIPFNYIAFQWPNFIDREGRQTRGIDN